MKYLYGIPTTDRKLYINVVQSIIEQLKWTVPNRHIVKEMIVTSTLIHSARNNIAQYAIENDFDYLFFHDSDCIIPTNTLEKLTEMDKDVAAGMYFSKSYPFTPVVYEQGNTGLFDVIRIYPKNTIMPVYGIGMGICLIKVSALKRLGENPFNPYQGKDTPVINGEDLAFCRRCYDSGINIFVNTSLQASHIGEREVSEGYYKNALQQATESQRTEFLGEDAPKYKEFVCQKN